MNHPNCKMDMFCEGQGSDYCTSFEPTEEFLKEKTCGQCESYVNCLNVGKRRIDWACADFYPLFGDFEQ